ncbi:hypothetical protein F3Y22_tig00111621pilonHSYRG00339 [Hibiscus syriacus]|uniref:Uncharacterized protein n=1 Tax=Hibiscus syriacus TaxID=106335 RepID=A0A6A2YCU8_HIBSY|nr:hypothetical protein F3Y22_tig00111621pilonHSYRG00339 [Hibiscus syriacus]
MATIYFWDLLPRFMCSWCPTLKLKKASTFRHKAQQWLPNFYSSMATIYFWDLLPRFMCSWCPTLKLKKASTFRIS